MIENQQGLSGQQFKVMPVAIRMSALFVFNLTLNVSGIYKGLCCWKMPSHAKASINEHKQSVPCDSAALFMCKCVEVTQSTCFG